VTASRSAVALVAASALGAGACSANESNGGAMRAPGRADSAAAAVTLDASPARRPDAGARTMTETTCEDARRAIEARKFVGWRGLPAGCSPADLFGIAADDEWGTRRLGGQSAQQRLLDVAGYHRPLLTVRDGVVVLFDGAYPELDGGWEALHADLGDPVSRLDYQDGTIVVAAGEWVYPDRGIAVYLSSDASKVYHVAVFAPTTLETYQDRLRPAYGTKRVPRR
jgi:hypothetical protein